jgi:hypothetical protein
MDTKTLDKILKLKRCGLSLRDIGTVVKMSPEGIRNAIKKYGWTRGDKKGRPTKNK